MKRVRAMFIALVVGLAIIIGCGLTTTPEDVRTQEEKNHVIKLQDTANSVVRHIQYIKDPRTDICFAYHFWPGGLDGIPSIATVPCEAIPPDLLTTAK